MPSRPILHARRRFLRFSVGSVGADHFQSRIFFALRQLKQACGVDRCIGKAVPDDENRDSFASARIGG